MSQMRRYFEITRFHSVIFGVLLTFLIGVIPSASYGQEPGLRDTRAQRPSELFWKAIEEARWGDIEAQYTIGWMYLNGEGIGQDNEQAAIWFERAAENGHPYAMFRIADMYQNGLGVEQDKAMAAQWFRTAAETGAARTDDAAYSAQLRQMQRATWSASQERQMQLEDRRWEAQVRAEQNRHQERVTRDFNRNNRYYRGWNTRSSRSSWHRSSRHRR